MNAAVDTGPEGGLNAPCSTATGMIRTPGVVFTCSKVAGCESLVRTSVVCWLHDAWPDTFHR